MFFIASSIILNGEISPLNTQKPFGLDGETYEMLRVYNGRALFLADHLLRFANSISAAGFARPQCWDKLPQLIEWLILCNAITNCDLRLCLSADGTFQAGFITSHYPTAKQYEQGVHCELLSAIRQKPTAKIYHAEMRKAASCQQSQCAAYESILVNPEQEITEGSRSNIFFVRGNKLYTAPDNVVLHGIMRKKLLEIAQKCKLEVIFDVSRVSEIGTYDAAFLTSTPMRILPIHSIGNVVFEVPNKTTKQLIDAMNDEIETQK